MQEILNLKILRVLPRLIIMKQADKGYWTAVTIK